MPDDAQPAEGQGAEATESPYDSYLQTVPEGAREAAETWFRDTSKGLDAKLQEAAQFRQQWEPYQNVELLRSYEPEPLNELLAWHQQVTASPEAFKEWLQNAAREEGLTPAEEQQIAEEAMLDTEITPERIEQLIAEKAAERIAPLEERLQNWEIEKAVDAEDQSIRSEFDRLQSENDVQLTNEQKADIIDLGINHEGQGSWIEHGFNRYRSMTSEAQKAFVEEKSNQPAAALTGGGTARLEPTRDWKQAEERTRERFRAMQQ